MTYNELLQQKEWWQKCNEILSRDRYKCRDCGCFGFHNGYNYMKVNRIEEIDALLNGWTFNGVVFSKFGLIFLLRNLIKSKKLNLKRHVIVLMESMCTN